MNETMLTPVERDDIARNCYLDRELSWLAFNRRVMLQAADPAVPLLERLKFLSIYQSNLEEFYMVRVGSLIHRSALLPDVTDGKTGWTASVQLRKILAETEKQQELLEKTYRRLLGDLKEKGMVVLDFRKLSKTDEVITKKYFSELRPLLSPRTVDVGRPFPFVGNRETCVAVTMGKGEDVVLGLVSLLRIPPYKVFEADGVQKIILTGELVEHYASSLFKKKELRETVLFRVTRNADVFIEDDLASLDADYRASMEKMLSKRKRQQPVRLVINGKPSGKLQEMLVRGLKVPEKNVFFSRIPFELGFPSGVRKEPGMKYDDRRSQKTVRLKKGEYFPYLEKKDILLAFPFQSMNSFVDLLYEAADDPAVVSIRITLYRLSGSSKVAAALAYAADRGKKVLCLLELRARFDEQNNIDYSEILEDAGCEVIYGLPDMKVHSKLCLITRQIGDTTRYITQVGTGNYNEVTSEQYTDLSVITSDPRAGEDAAAVFDALSQGNVPEAMSFLWVAPESFRTRVLEMIEGETAKGENGSVTIKVNGMNDAEIMAALVRASRAGVRVELFIRGICCLRPGVPGYTEHITVKSIVGRYLEHSRIFAFGTGEERRLFVGSGDLLNRNTRRRVEAFIECVTPETREGVERILSALRDDREKGWVMQTDGTYTPLQEPGTSSQEALYQWFGKQTVENIPQCSHGWLWRLFHRKQKEKTKGR